MAGSRWLALQTLLLTAAAAPVAAGAPGSAFEPVYELLASQCGECHIQGQADGPWSLDTPPSKSYLPECLSEPVTDQLRCTTYHQLVDAPAPGIPAWIRPAEAPLSEPYAQACDPAVSFHIGHSLPARLPEDACAMFLRWIEDGALR